MMNVSGFQANPGKKTPPTMAKSDTDMGINSWLEDELYQQYLHDRSTVDESWKHVFDDTGARPIVQPGNGGSPVAVRTAVPAATHAPAGPQPGPQDELQPLRGVAGKIA